MQQSPLAIDIKKLNKTYADGTLAIKDIDLQIPQGSFFALLGANGAGKTTTIGVITDLVRKTSGSVKIFGTDIDENFSAAKYHIGVVPQEFNFGFFEKVLDIVTTQAGYYGMPLHVARPKALHILERLGLSSKLSTQARSLSGGMKRRLMIARALIHEPKLLILDEPTAGVDAQLRIGMWEYLREINTKHNVTILLTTHYLEEVEQLCESAAIIKDGRIVRLDTVKNLLSSLEKEHYSLDIKIHGKNIEMPSSMREKLMKSQFHIGVQKDKSLDIIIDTKQHSLGELILYLNTHGITITSIRTKGNRLETLFLNIIE